MTKNTITDGGSAAYTVYCLYTIQTALHCWSILYTSEIWIRKANSQEIDHLVGQLREVPGKSKWKFKMAFAMKGAGGSRGGLVCH